MTRIRDGFAEEPATFRFGNFVLDPAQFRLTRDGEAVRIEPKALEVLAYLIRHPDRVVSKDELLDAVWKGTFVTPNALTRAIAQLRKVLGDAVGDPRFIETVPTRGYRFIGVPSTTAVAAPSFRPAVEIVPPRRQWWRFILTAAVAALLAFVLMTVALGFLAARREIRATIKKPRPAVLSRLGASPLVSSPGLHIFPALSPDGNRMAYSSDAAGTLQIHVLDLRESKSLRITDDPDGAIQPSWSPDGNQIVYASARRGGLRIVSASGGAARTLTSSGSRPAWSPDGDEIVFQTSTPADLGGTAFEAYPPSSLSIVNVSSGRVEPLTRAGVPPGGHGAPSWRSDGKRIVFASCEIEQCAIFTLGRDGSSLTEVARRTVTLVSPVFTPDGRSVVHILNRYRSAALMATEVSREGEAIQEATVLRGSEPALMHHATVSPDGRRFAWSQIDETSRLVATRLNASGKPVGEPAILTAQSPTIRATSPSFSPGGTKVAWSSVGGGDDGGIWIANADGKDPRPVSLGAQLKQNVRWAPDGWAVFYSIWHEGPVIIATSLINGQSQEAFRPPRDASPPVVSPDATHIAFTRSLGGVSALWVMSADRSEMRKLTRESDLARYPVWSPKGTDLAVQTRRGDGTTAIATIPASGGELKILTTGDEIRPSSWSADGRFIVFAGKRDGIWNIWSVQVDTGALTRLTNNDSLAVFLRDPAWSPDGRQVVYEMGTTTSQIWMSNPAAVQ